MKLYQAPLEGITSYIYRNAVNKYFGGVDKYFTPFVCPHEKIVITDRDAKQLSADNNKGYELVPQILTVNSKGFLELTDYLHSEFGYEEFNLNFGCPSGTVVSKGRGAGVFNDLRQLDKFLDEIFEKSDYKISVKTRLGMTFVSEFEDILGLYNKYPISELIIHPRVRDELYNGVPHYDVYKDAKDISKAPTVYNGNITSEESLDKIVKEIGAVNDEDMNFMIGRGMVANPAIFRVLKGGPEASSDELSDFLEEIKEGYIRDFSGEVPVLHKLKEIWSYMGPYLLEKYDMDDKLVKKILKAKRLNEYDAVKGSFFL